MSAATPSRPSTDHNLLFGVLSLQMDFITRDALIEAMHAWVLDKAKPLGQILVDQHALRPDQHGALEVLVNLHLEQHSGDVEKCLATLDVPAPLRPNYTASPTPTCKPALLTCQRRRNTTHLGRLALPHRNSRTPAAYATTSSGR
jgi:hypothetical protein